MTGLQKLVHEMYILSIFKLLLLDKIFIQELVRRYNDILSLTIHEIHNKLI